MKIYPAIDIKNGKCVRLYQGQADQVTEYGDDPTKMALTWIKQGAKRLHLVDLDGAFNGLESARTAILAIRKSTSLPLQVGGGIRSVEDVKTYLDAGLDRIILGTMAINNPDLLKILVAEYGEKIVVSVDAKDGYVTTDGWVKSSKKTALEFFEELNTIGVQTVVYTDIARDGAMIGPNVEALQKANRTFKGTVIASGGVSCEKDLLKLESIGITDAIVGKALYEGEINLQKVEDYYDKKGQSNAL